MSDGVTVSLSDSNITTTTTTTTITSSSSCCSNNSSTVHCQLVGQYDLVINCTGLGSQQLINDSQLVPNRGHLVSVRIIPCPVYLTGNMK